MQGDKLLPCPFCCGKPMVFGDHEFGTVACSQCYAKTGTLFHRGTTRSEAIAAWNSRAPAVTPTREEVARVIAQCASGLLSYSKGADAILALLNGEIDDGR